MDVEDIDTDKSAARSSHSGHRACSSRLADAQGCTGRDGHGQIAERVGLPRSTVQRIVQALQEERLVITTGAAGRVRLGQGLHALAGAARYNIVRQLRPFLQELMEETGEAVDLSVLRGGRMIFLDQVQGTHRLRAVSSVGEVFPVTSTANGRACLALMSDTEARKLAENEWDRLSDSRDWPALSKALTKARAHGPGRGS